MRLPEGSVRELEGGWGYFELDLDALFEQCESPWYRDVITYPPVKQDLAFVVAEDVNAEDLVAAAKDAAGLESCTRCGRSTSTAATRCPRKEVDRLRGRVQSPERTLADEDAAALRKRIVAALADSSAVLHA